MRGWHSLGHGDLRGAEVDARTALDASGLPLSGLVRMHSVASLALTLLETDRADEAEALLLAEMDGAETATRADAVVRLARGRVRLARRRPADALRDYAEVGETARRLDVDTPCLLPWRSSAALAHLALGDRDRARGLAAAELDLALAFGAPRTRGAALRAVGLTTEGPDGEQSLREAVAGFADAGAVLDQAQALHDLGARLRRRDRHEESRRLLRSALELADRTGATRLAAAVVAELHLTGDQPRRDVTGPRSLTAGERRVADLAAAGSSDREIAESLFVTVRTVRTHLAEVFHKLDVSSREHLADALTD